MVQLLGSVFLPDVPGTAGRKETTNQRNVLSDSKMVLV